MFKTVPYQFLIVVKLKGLSALLSALVCRCRWNSLAVLKERDLLLGNNINRIKAYITKWRANAVRLTIKAFKTSYKTERRAFRDHLYYKLLNKSVNSIMAPLELDQCKALKASNNVEFTKEPFTRQEGPPLLVRNEGVSSSRDDKIDINIYK